MSADQMTAAQTKFVHWLLLPEAERVALGLPRTETEYAVYIDKSDRTLRDWKKRPAVAEAIAGGQRLAQSRPAPVQPAPDLALAPEAGDAGQPVSTGSPVGDVVAATFQLLARQIAAGDLKAVDPLLRMPTVKAYMDAEIATMNSTFDQLSDAELTEKLLAEFSDDELEAELDRRRSLAEPDEPAAPQGADQ